LEERQTTPSFTWSLQPLEALTAKRFGKTVVVTGSKLNDEVKECSLYKEHIAGPLAELTAVNREYGATSDEKNRR